MKIFLVCVATAFLLMGCQIDPGSALWISPKLKSHISAVAKTAESPAIPFWINGAQSLNFIDQKGKDAVISSLGNATMVMVSFPFNSMLGMQLSGDARTLVHYRGAPEENGYAMVRADDRTYHSQLAELAHGQSGNGLACGNIVSLSLSATLLTETTITPPVYRETVKLSSIANRVTQPSASNILDTIAELESLGTRRHLTASGLATPGVVESLFKTVGGSIEGIEFEQVDHSSTTITQQKSLIVRIPGTDAAQRETKIILGSHLDSTNSSGSAHDAPGADDNASGVATLVEILRIIADSGDTFSRTIELHAYAAEEDGLLGSQDIARKYQSSGTKVGAMMQFDMNSYSKDPSSQTIYLVENDTSPTLRRSLKDLLNTYLGGDYVEKKLSGGTSDHRSWTYAGFPAVFPFEDPDGYNKALHSINDTSATLNNSNLSARFASLGLAFLGHHAGLKIAASEYSSTTIQSDNKKDLKLAIINSESAGYYFIGVGAPIDVVEVELCLIDEAGSALCTAERVKASQKETKGERALYLSDEPVALKPSKRIAVFGYNENETLVHQRSVVLSNP